MALGRQVSYTFSGRWEHSFLRNRSTAHLEAFCPSIERAARFIGPIGRARETSEASFKGLNRVPFCLFVFCRFFSPRWRMVLSENTCTKCVYYTRRTFSCNASRKSSMLLRRTPDSFFCFFLNSYGPNRYINGMRG